MKTVGEVAELAGVTVRALHHYDELGLLSPSERSDASYRLYSYDDLARLQRSTPRSRRRETEADSRR